MSATPDPLIPRIRRVPISSDSQIVVRGESTDDPGLSIRQARLFLRRFPDWGRFGLSAFVARSDEDVMTIGHDHLDKFAVLAVYDTDDVRANGFQLVATFRNPHVTIAFVEEPTAAVGLLLSLPHRLIPNPSYRQEDQA